MKGSRSKVHSVLHFGSYEVDLSTEELRRAGMLIRLHGQPFQVLGILLERPGEVVTRDELRKRLWLSDTFVDFDHSLNTAINKIREALGDSADNPRFVQTLPRRGYRFIAPVIEPSYAAAAETRLDTTPSSQTPPAVEPSNAATHTGTRYRWALVPIALVLVLGAGIYAAKGRFRSRAQPPSGKMMLAVLPFENLSGDPQQEYFSDGLTEETITQLGELNPERLGVIARTSVMGYRKTKERVNRIGRDLHVNFVLEGSVRHEGDEVRVTAQLIRVSDETHLWAATYDRSVNRVLPLQGEIAQAIALAIEIKLSPEEEMRLASIYAVSPEAHEAYLRGRYLWSTHTEEGLNRSIQHFRHAIAIEPNYAQAYAGLSASYGVLGVSYLPPRDMFPKSRAAAMKALEIDPKLAYGHAALGANKLFYEWDWQGAEVELKRAIELNPNDAEAHDLYASYLEAMGRLPEAVKEMQYAHQLDPLALNANVDLGTAYYYTHEFDRAIEQYQRTLEISQESGVYQHLGLAYLQKHMYEEAIAALEEGVKVAGGSTAAIARLGYGFGMAGKRREALQQLDRLNHVGKKSYVFPEDAALVYASLGDKDNAFELLQKAVESRSWVMFLKVDPAYETLRNDPRFDQLMQRIFLPSQPNKAAM